MTVFIADTPREWREKGGSLAKKLSAEFGLLEALIDGTVHTSATVDEKFIHFSFQSTSATGSVHAMRIDLEQTVNTTGAPRALTLRTDLKHPSGHTISGGNCVDAQIQLYTGNTGISGEMHAMESKMRIAEETRNVQGTYCAHKFTNQIKTGNTMPATTFFHRFYDVGPVYTPLMFDFSGLTAGASNCIVANTAALAAAEYFLRVKSPDGGTGYIPILSALN